MLNFRPYYLTLLSRIFHPTVTVPLFSHSFTHTCTSTLYHSILLTQSCTQLSFLSTLSPTFSSSYPFLTPLPNLTPFHHLSFFSSLIILSSLFYSILSPLLLTPFSQPISSHLNHHSRPVYPNYLLTTSISLHSLHASLLTSSVSQPTFFEISFSDFTQFSNAYQGHSLIPLSKPTLLPLIPLSHYPLTPV